MGLDGISINQLRVTQENNSAELNNQARFSLNNDMRIVDGLSNGQRIDPDKEKEKEKQKGQAKDSSSSEDDNDNKQYEDDTTEEIATIKYDLSRSDKYSLKVDDDTNSILIVDKSTKDVVQLISPEQLSHVVAYLSNPQGSIINKRY